MKLKKTLSMLLSLSLIFSTGAVSVSAEESTPSDDGYVYGTVDLPYADYYYGEINDVDPDVSYSLNAKDAVTEAGYRDTGMYDAVSSATTSTKSRGVFASSYWEETETGTDILGVKDVAVAIPADLYEKALEAINSGKECDNKLLEIVRNFEISSTTPSSYKILNGEGLLTASNANDYEDDNSSVELKVDQTKKRGNYILDVESDHLPSASDIEGVIITTSDGKKYGLEHLENIWLKTNELEVAVEDGINVRGAAIDYLRYEDLPSKTITQIKYLSKNSDNLVITPAEGLKVKKLLSDDEGISTTSDELLFKQGASAELSTNLPSDSNYSLSSVVFQNNELIENTDYTFDGTTFTLNDTDTTDAGTYTLTFTDSEYQDIPVEITFNSGLSDEGFAIEYNNIVVPDEVSVSSYVANITSVIVNGSNYGTAAVFNSDGSVNFDATVTRHGKTSSIFTEEGNEYDITVKSAGFPSITGTVVYGTIDPVYSFKEYRTKTYCYDQYNNKITGIVSSNGAKYYFDPDKKGMMKTSAFFTLDENGESYTYRALSSGKLATGFVKTWNAKYYFDENYHMVNTGFTKIDDKTYYFSKDGKMYTGWITVGEDTYRFAVDGTMITGTIKAWGKTYNFDENGKLIK